ncbi:MAG: class I SAM-dependent methyltransferase [Lentisphaeria bacterium]|nr:class I SAM-dependent methyltransferase [Lentisphaeria bacterium]
MPTSLPRSSWDVVLAQARSVLGTYSSDACRIFHGRGGCFSGFEHLAIDWLSPVLLITLYAPVDPEDLVWLADQLRSETPCSCVLVQRRHEPKAPWHVLWGTPPVAPTCQENGLRYQLLFQRNQNTGFFLDMRCGRDLVRRLAPERRVLNLFAYTCSFSVAAIAGGAKSVVNIDMSSAALSVGRENHRLNEQDLSSVRFLAHDIKKTYGKIKRMAPFDLIVIDPPTDQGRSFRVRDDYARIVRRLEDWCAPGARIVACLNAPELPGTFLEEIFATEAPSLQLLDSVAAPAEFTEAQTEGALKIRVYRFAVQ